MAGRGGAGGWLIWIGILGLVNLASWYFEWGYTIY